MLPSAAPPPAPAPLLHLLSVALFALHLVPVVVAIGGGLWSLAAGLSDAPALRAVHRRLARALPGWTAAAATAGAGAVVVLFARHGGEALPAAVIMAWPWVALGPLLLLAAAGHFAQAAFLDRRLPLAHTLGAAGTGALLLVSFVFASHASLSLDPARHLALHLADRGGATLPLGDAALWLRWLHLLAVAVAAGALWSAREAARLGPDGLPALRVAGLGLAGAAVAAFLLGIGTIAALPPPARAALLGGDLLATAALALSVLATGSMAAIAFKAATGDRAPRRVTALAGHLLAVLALMAVMRDGVREALRTAAGVAPPPPPSSDVAGGVVFLVVLVGGVAALAWVARAWQRATRSEP
jgi:hypothetical protein